MDYIICAIIALISQVVCKVMDISLYPSIAICFGACACYLFYIVKRERDLQKKYELEEAQVQKELNN